MRRRIVRTTAVAALALAGLGAAAAGAQHGHGQGTRHQGHAPGDDAHRRVQACLAEADAVIGQGLGFGMAFAADRNGYPGPVHVLELRDRLGLTAEQEGKLAALQEAMFATARPASARLLAAEARLERLFAEAQAEAPAVRAAVAEVERARADVRAVHLLTHLQTRDLLTDAQRHEYHAARWGAR
jgi:hypothetical protein